MKIKVIAFNKDIIDDVFDIQQKAYKPLFDKYQDKETNPYMESKEVVLENTPGRALTDMCLLKMTCLLAQSG